jgi:hypothetical protein
MEAKLAAAMRIDFIHSFLEKVYADNAIRAPLRFELFIMWRTMDTAQIANACQFDIYQFRELHVDFYFAIFQSAQEIEQVVASFIVPQDFFCFCFQ